MVRRQTRWTHTGLRKALVWSRSRRKRSLTITRNGKIKDVQEVRILVTDASGNITATRTINADLTIKGTLTADKVIGAVYA